MQIDYQDFLQYIREQPCSVCFEKPSDPDHLNQIGMGRNRKNPNLIEHWSCVPLCRHHHIKRHAIGTKAFEKHYKVNLWKDNADYLTTFLKNKGVI